MAAASPRDDIASALTAAAALVAIVGPALLAFNQPPSATFLNQAVAVVGWGILLAALAWVLGRSAVARAGIDSGAWSLTAALGLVGIAAMVTLAAGRSNAALVWSATGLIAAALLTAVVGIAVARAGHAEAAFRALAIALVAAGVLSSLVSLVQVFAPSLADGNLIAAPSIEGRASGNLRQPNHLCSLLLWSMIALVWLAETRMLHRAVAGGLALLFVPVLVLSASRTGWIGLAVLAVWGVVDRGLSRQTRIALVLTPVAYALVWAGLTAWAAATGHVFYGQSRVSGMQDISSSRYGIWSNTLSLIASHPWFGVGWGEFNFAWSLAPFPGRPVAFFDHTHNVVLNFAVELGLPLATLVCGLFVHALWRSLRGALQARGEQAVLLRSALMIVVMMVIHSQLEYPLWYAYFLLPTAMAFGLTLATPLAAQSPHASDAGAAGSQVLQRTLLAACALMTAGGVAAIVDYQRVVAVFAPSDDAPPLAARIAAGQKSWFFSHHANYAAATTLPPSQALPAVANASHYLLDTRLMIAWAEGLAATGEVDKARHIAARLREFRNSDSVAFFEPCDKPQPGMPLPFQCTPPSGRYDASAFR